MPTPFDLNFLFRKSSTGISPRAERRFLFLLALAFLFCLHAPHAHALVAITDNSITGLYHFENTNDSSGNGRNLTEVGTVGYTVTGKKGKASNTSSTGQWTVPSAAMDVSGDFTIGYWLYANYD